MGYTVRTDGSIVADTLDEAIAASERFRAKSSVKREVVPASTNGAVPDNVERFLTVVAEAGKAGIESGPLVTRLGGHAKGLGSLRTKANRIIIEASQGKSASTFLWKRSKPGEPTKWFANAQKLIEIGLLKGGEHASS